MRSLAMQWEGRQESGNVEDRRFGGKALALGGGSLLLVVIGVLFGVNPQRLVDMFGGGGGGGGGEVQVGPKDPAEEKMASFTKIILKDTEDVWDDLFRRNGKTYQKPTLVLFSGRVKSACGLASTAVGPFYCPGDEKVYIDLSFYKQLEEEL